MKHRTLDHNTLLDRDLGVSQAPFRPRPRATGTSRPCLFPTSAALAALLAAIVLVAPVGAEGTGRDSKSNAEAAQAPSAS
jgi:hypothetical protein